MFPNSSSSLEVEVAGLNRGLNAHTLRGGIRTGESKAVTLSDRTALRPYAWLGTKTELEADAQEEEVADAA